MRAIVMLVCALFVVEGHNGPGSSSDGRGAPAAKMHQIGTNDIRLTVLHHVTVSLAANQPERDRLVDGIFSNMSEVLALPDGANDYPCPIRFQRDSAVGTFDGGSGIINNNDQLNQVLAQDADVIIVMLINFCETRFGIFLGCSKKGGPAVVVPPAASNINGIIWAHEQGHVVGLKHTFGNQERLMYHRIDSTSRQVTMQECDAFQGG